MKEVQEKTNVLITRFIRQIKNLSKTVKEFALKPEGFFVLFAISFGTIFVFLTPPLQAPDEQSHFFQAYSVSNLNFVWDKFEVDGRAGYGPKLPKSVFVAADAFLHPVAGSPKDKISLGLYKKYINQPLNPQDTTYDKNGTSYSPLVYIPQAIGISIGKLFNTSPLVIMWLGRFANLVVWTALIYVSIKIFPFAKWAIAILALNPVTVFLSASMSADVMNIALTFLFFSVLGSIILSKKDIISRPKIVLLTSVLIGLALTKPVNILFGLLLLIIPWRRFRTKAKFAGFVAIGMVLMGITTLAWNAAISEGTQFSIQLQRPGIGISPSEQLAGVIHAPLHFVKIIIQNYILVQPGYYGNDVLTTFFGVFGWLDTNIPLWTIILYILALFFAALYQIGRGGSFSRFQKAGFLVVFFGLLTANILAMYLVYTPIGQPIVDGVQGRYFIPAAVLLLGLFTGRKKILQLQDRQICIVLGLAMLTVLIMMLIKIFLRYYITP